ncbi:MAG: HAD hydrolase-like protein, partial [Candidatus Micrarchaeota archaeon]|nr:HAD hydrolase-like protein [Candidatus Micrarchaeota archaeon]
QSSVGARKNLWLPTDDKPWFVGAQWDTNNKRESSKLRCNFMDENFEVTTVDVSSAFKRAYASEYTKLAQAQAFGWAKDQGKYVLFDMDGTIIGGGNKIHENALKGAMELVTLRLTSFGLGATSEEINAAYEKARGEAREELWKFGQYRDMEMRMYLMLMELAREKIKSGEVIAQLRVIAREAYQKYWDQRLENSQVFPQAIACIEEMKKAGYSVVLFSDRRDSEAMDLLRKKVKTSEGEKELSSLFDAMIVTNDLASESYPPIPLVRLGMPKEKYTYALIREHLEPRLMVGDSRRHDIHPAREAGIAAVRVKEGEGFDGVIAQLAA